MRCIKQKSLLHTFSLLMKVIAQGDSRDEARTRLINGLEKSQIVGIRTNRNFLIDLLKREAVANGEQVSDDRLGGGRGLSLVALGKYQAVQPEPRPQRVRRRAAVVVEAGGMRHVDALRSVGCERCRTNGFGRTSV